MRAVVFDLGDTLVEYEGMPLSWEAHYPRALSELTRSLGTSFSAEAMGTACGVLRTFNTRVNPRVDEVSFQMILSRLAEFVGVQAAESIKSANRIRASFFFAVGVRVNAPAAGPIRENQRTGKPDGRRWFALPYPDFLPKANESGKRHSQQRGRRSGVGSRR